MFVLLSQSRASGGLYALAGQMFERGEVSKVYVALCSSSDAEPPQWGQLELNTGHGRSRHGLWRVSGSEGDLRHLPAAVREPTLRTYKHCV